MSHLRGVERLIFGQAESTGCRKPIGSDTMMSYTFIPSLIYNAGEVAAAWAVVALLFGLLAFA